MALADGLSRFNFDHEEMRATLSRVEIAGPPIGSQESFLLAVPAVTFERIELRRLHQAPSHLDDSSIGS